MVAFSIPVHDKQPVHSMGVLSLTDTPMVVTGAHDSIKVCDVSLYFVHRVQRLFHVGLEFGNHECTTNYSHYGKSNKYRSSQ